MSLLFPELRDAEEAAPPSAKRPVAVEVEGNDHCVRAFSAALRLPVPCGAVHLLVDGTIRIRLETANVDAPLAILLVEPTSRHWKRGPGFAMGYSGKLPVAFHAPLLKFLLRYQRTSLRAFADRIRALAIVRAEANAPARRDDDPLRLAEDMDRALFRSYGIAAQWRTFLEDHDLYRGSCGQLRTNVVSIKHSDIECQASAAPQNAWGAGSFAGLATDTEPWSSDEAGRDSEFVALDTHLSDRDVILGGDARLDEALDAVAAMPRRPDLVLLGSTCVSVVTGDDLEASAERARRKHGLTVKSLGCVEHPTQDALLAQLASVERAPVGHAAVLVGMPRVAGIRTLLATLRTAGVEIDGPMIPDLPAGFLQSVGRAGVFVVYDQVHTRQGVHQLLDQFPDVPVLAPPPPFSLAAAREFCITVATACGRADGLQLCWDARYGGLDVRWQELAARAARYRIAVVSDHCAWDTRLWMRLGVPLLETLRAMQFGIEVLVYATDGEVVAESRDPEIRVRRFTSQAELTALLRDSDAALVYSEMRYDPRVTRTGHASVSLEDFRCGVEGSLHTLETLVRRCELPWFRRYGGLAAAADDQA